MVERYKVLLVEDDEVDRMAFERFVRHENLPYDFTIASSIAEARQVLDDEQFDVALMDYSLGDGKSSELFEAARRMPIIIMTGSSDLHIAVELMKAGAYDFLTKDPQGNYLIALPVTVKNAIERWQAQQELAQYRDHLERMIEQRTAEWLEGELRLQTIVESIPIVVFSLDAEAKFTFIAGHTQEILGYPPHAFIGQTLFLLFPNGSEANTRFQDVINGGAFADDVQIDGRWVSISASPKWEHGSIVGVTGVVHDIGERKRAELAIMQERNLLRTLIDNLPDYIFVKDREGRFIETNRAHAAGANLSREEIIGRTAKEVFDPAVAEQFHADDNYVLTSGQSITNEERITTAADGSQRWVLTTKVPLYNDTKNNIIGLVGISRDITERRKAEEERLHAERLRNEIDQERELVEMKHRFIATASHDFRTPLTVIKMSANTLEVYFDKISPERRVAKLQQIQSQVDHMVRLLDDVLVVSKASGGKVAFSPGTLDLRSLCERVWEDMVEMDKQNHQHQFEFLASVQQIVADGHLLQHILVNLLSNAFKYTPLGGNVQFQVTNDDQFVRFRISDSGYGIPEAEQKHLFEPFYRATNVKNFEGTGLGLVIVKAYIELHDGTVTMQSQEGVGTTFIVQLPHGQ